MTEIDHEHELLLQVVNAVYGANDLDSALRGMAQALQAVFPVWHTSLWVHDAGHEIVRVVATWSVADSAFSPGVEVATNITPPLARMLVDLHKGMTFGATMDDHGKSLLDSLMREEGVVELMTVPLTRTAGRMPFLALGCSTSGGFGTTPPSFFLSIAASCAARLITLATVPKRD